MSQIKNPQNRNALPSVILSNFDNKGIYEIKIKYEKLARLDKIEVETMQFDDQDNIIFEKISFNSEPSSPNSTEIHITLENKEYIITGQKSIIPINT